MLILLCFSFCCCGKGSTRNISEYLAWISDESNGLSRTKRINGIEITAKFLPPEYRAYQEARSMEGTETFDMLVDRYDSSVTFLLSFNYDEIAGYSRRGVISTDSEYFIDRAAALSLNIADYVQLDAGGMSFIPVVSTFDQDFGMNPSRNIIIAFVDESGTGKLATAPKLDLILNDEAFETGISHFVFTRDAIDNRIKLDYH